jgi:hypothetical protein
VKNSLLAFVHRREILPLALFVIVVLSGLCFSTPAHAGADIEVTTTPTEHTVVMPFEKSYRFIATIRNNGSTTETIGMTIGSDIPQDWHLLAPAGQYRLAPGQSIDYVAVFEPGTGPDAREQTVKVPVSFSWNGGSQEFEITVKTKILSFSDLEKESVRTRFSVVDKSNGRPVTGAYVVATLPSGLESYYATPAGDGYGLLLPSGDYVKKFVRDYQVDHTCVGYYLQVYAEGYRGYFESGYLPEDGDLKTVALEPLDKVAEYSLQKTVASGYSIWWIRASADGKYFAFSQGAHGQPGREPPEQTKVLLTDDSGSVIWEKQTGGECWGVDISPDGEYVAAGCHDGNIYLWDKDGNEVWKHNSTEGHGEGALVRWVKFSPDGNCLLSGPVAANPGDAGLFEVETGKLLWSAFTGDWLREARFSADGKTVYLSSGNGAVYAVDGATGEPEWLGSGGHVIPFLLGINEQAGILVSSGKGRAFTALSLSDGSRRWQTVVDQTVTSARMAHDGSIVGATVGGMSYGVNADGSLKWFRRYGGVGHNGVYYTGNGKYALLGGPNPTLFDNNGNVLWQREKDKRINMTGPAEQDTGGANTVWVSEDASLIILGGDDGKIDFYRGSVTTGSNSYSQLSGMDVAAREERPPQMTPGPVPAPVPAPKMPPGITPTTPTMPTRPVPPVTEEPKKTPEEKALNGGLSCSSNPGSKASVPGELIILMGGIFVCRGIVRFRHK